MHLFLLVFSAGVSSHYNKFTTDLVFTARELMAANGSIDVGIISTCVYPEPEHSSLMHTPG